MKCTPFRAGENEFDFRMIDPYLKRDKKEVQKFPAVFTPAPKGSLLEILSTGGDEIKCTPFRIGEKWI